ncbi:MAG: site-specific integrase [Deltaproteobacteria bacterium]|nr:site-specific integrase [Deltaproteobacteria bacterium]
MDTIPTPSPTLRTIATAWLQDREEDYEAGELALNTIRLYRRLILKRIVPGLGDRPVAEVTLAEVRQFHRKFARRPAEGNHALNLLRRVLRAAEEQGHRPRDSNFARRVRKHAELASANPASRLEVTRMFEVCADIRAGRLELCHPTLAALFQVVQVTGARPSEIRRCRWTDLELRPDYALLHLDEHKTSRGVGRKSIRLDAIGRGVFLSLNPDDPVHATWVFPSHRGRGKPYCDITRAWRRVVDYTQRQSGLCLRDFRSGLATNAYAEGVPLEIVQEMMGHKSIVTTRHYTRISHERVVDAYRVTNASVFSAQKKKKRRR